MRLAPVFIVAFACALMLGACSSSSATSAPTAAPTAAASAAPSAAGGTGASGAGATTAVSIKDFAFNPATSTVAAGGTVEWTNNDSTAHTVTFDDTSIKSSGNVDGGAKFSTTFAKAGSFKYHCTIHSNMQGTVTVS